MLGVGRRRWLWPSARAISRQSGTGVDRIGQASGSGSGRLAVLLTPAEGMRQEPCACEVHNHEDGLRVVLGEESRDGASCDLLLEPPHGEAAGV